MMKWTTDRSGRTVTSDVITGSSPSDHQVTITRSEIQYELQVVSLLAKT